MTENNKTFAGKDILLLGNGINRLFEGGSWDNIIKEFCQRYGVEYDEETFREMPYNMRIVTATNDTVDKSMKELCEKMRDIPVCDEQKDFIKNLLELPFEQILTANYTYEIEKTVCEKKKYNPIRIEPKKYGSNDMMLHRPIKLCFDEKDRYIWHIHGHAGSADSVIMGHYYYGKLLSEIQKYIPVFMRRYKGCEKYGSNFRAESWVDHFMLSNVHILGLGMDFTESDLWWLACCKKRHFPNSRIFFYEPAENISAAKRMMMKCYGIVIPELHISGEDFKGFYKQAVAVIRDRLAENGSFEKQL